MQRLVIEGVTLIASEYNTLKLQTKLESFLTPSVRETQHRSLEDIKAHYARLREENAALADRADLRGFLQAFNGR